MALGINNIVGVSGMFVGLVLGGLLAPINWRLVFLISVPVGLFGTVISMINTFNAIEEAAHQGGGGGVGGQAGAIGRVARRATAARPVVSSPICLG